MSRFLRKFFIAMSVSVLLLATACAVTPPVQEMSNARQSIQAAIDAGAETLASSELAEARSLLKDASTELESGEYLQARDNALQAKEYAIKARQTALMKQKKQ